MDNKKNSSFCEQSDLSAGGGSTKNKRKNKRRLPTYFGDTINLQKQQKIERKSILPLCLERNPRKIVKKEEDVSGSRFISIHFIFTGRKKHRETPM